MGLSSPCLPISSLAVVCSSTEAPQFPALSPIFQDVSGASGGEGLQAVWGHGHHIPGWMFSPIHCPFLVVIDTDRFFSPYCAHKSTRPRLWEPPGGCIPGPENQGSSLPWGVANSANLRSRLSSTPLPTPEQWSRLSVEILPFHSSLGRPFLAAGTGVIFKDDKAHSPPSPS